MKNNYTKQELEQFKQDALKQIENMLANPDHNNPHAVLLHYTFYRLHLDVNMPELFTRQHVDSEKFIEVICQIFSLVDNWYNNHGEDPITDFYFDVILPCKYYANNEEEGAILELEEDKETRDIIYATIANAYRCHAEGTSIAEIQTWIELDDDEFGFCVTDPRPSYRWIHEEKGINISDPYFAFKKITDECDDVKEEQMIEGKRQIGEMKEMMESVCPLMAEMWYPGKKDELLQFIEDNKEFCSNLYIISILSLALIPKHVNVNQMVDNVSGHEKLLDCAKFIMSEDMKKVIDGAEDKSAYAFVCAAGVKTQILMSEKGGMGQGDMFDLGIE